MRLPASSLQILFFILVFGAYSHTTAGIGHKNDHPTPTTMKEAPKNESLQVQSEPDWVQLIPEDKVIEWRRHIHQNPEVSFKEYETSEYVANILESFESIEVIRPTETSVLGILRGDKQGKTVAFRADLDALPLQEETGLPYASQVPDVMHACGHDVHTAMLLGTAATLSKMKDKIRGTVYFLFQHAEEQHPGGAMSIIETGALDEVDAFFGMHVLPNFPVGHIGILPDGAASTTADAFYLTIKGKGSHGSMPHLGVDPIVIGAEIVGGLQTIVSRNAVPGEMAVLSIGKFQAGNVPNVIADKAELAATIRTITPETRALVRERVETIVENLTKAYSADYELEYINSYPSIMNDPGLNAFARKSAAKILGEDRIFDAPMMTASEDFAYYAKKAPVVFMTLGVGEGVANHHPMFDPDEEAFANGVKTQIQVILDYLNKNR